MSTINEQIVTGRAHRVLIDKVAKLWQRISFWTKASDVEFNDGNTAETKVGAIKGITTDLNTTETGYAADMTALAQLNSDIVKYNSDTDSLDVYLDGSLVGSLPVHFAEFDLLDTSISDWQLTNLTMSKGTGTLTFNCISAGNYKAIYKKKINVQEGKRLYSIAGNSGIFASGNLSVCTNSENNSSVATITYPSNSGGSKSSPPIPAGEYYFIFWGYGNAGSATFSKLMIS